MSGRGLIGKKLRESRARFLRSEDGAGLVEFSLVVLLFLFLLFAIIDFGRLANTWVEANKATQLAARIAAVRPPVCAGVPQINERGTLTSPNFGTLCRAGSGTCADPGDVICTGVAGDPTADEIYARILPLLPPDTGIENLRFAYTPDPELGFLGGPYVPMVTVELTGVEFSFVSQLGLIIGALTGSGSTLGGAAIDVPGMSVSLPGEDLNLGTGG